MLSFVTILLSGCMIGLFSSLHCLGMCGPISLLIYKRKNHWATLMHNLGRVCCYALLGWVVGTIGMGLNIAGVQQYLSVLVGALMVAWVVFPKAYALNLRFFGAVVGPLRTALLKAKQADTPLVFFASGLIHGLLPCGMVYIGLSSGLATGSPVMSALLMTGFGLGTLPIMLSLGLGNVLTKGRLKAALRWARPALLLFIGTTIIIRGLGLEIPYLSPVLTLIGPEQEITVCGR